MFDSRTMVANSAVVNRLRQHKRHVMRTVIPRSEPINQANLTSMPIQAHAPESRGAQAYDALSREVQRIQV
jgi:cellulose biosynthesis protein BcsQ